MYYKRYNQTYQGRNYYAGNNGPKFYNYGQSVQNQMRKHSGCRVKFSSRSGKDGVYMSGWNKSRQGFMSFVACLAKKGACEGRSPSGNWLKMVVKIKPANGQPYLVTGFYYPESKKMRIPDLNMVANPYAPNGGYFGKSGRPRR